jgi:hypothetical protein
MREKGFSMVKKTKQVESFHESLEKGRFEMTYSMEATSQKPSSDVPQGKNELEIAVEEWCGRLEGPRIAGEPSFLDSLNPLEKLKYIQEHCHVMKGWIL